jgi:hypothetical protein
MSIHTRSGARPMTGPSRIQLRAQNNWAHVLANTRAVSGSVGWTAVATADLGE